MHAPVLRFDLLRALARPIDGGRTLRGRRIFGDNKSWRGAIVMLAGVWLATMALAAWPPWWTRLPAPVQAAGAPLVGALVGIGFVAGELPNSFFKRQLDIAPGAQRRSVGGVLWSLYDQGDFVPGIWLALWPIYAIPASAVVRIFGVAVVVHLIVNVIGFTIGARKNWL